MLNFVSRSALPGAAVSLALVAFLGASPPATAAAAETVQRRVAYGDLDLQRSSDVAVLRGRVALAAKVVCGELYAAPFSEAHERRACVTETRSRTSPRIAQVVRAARGRTVVSAQR